MVNSPHPSPSGAASKLDAYLRLRRLKNAGLLLLALAAVGALVGAGGYLQSSARTGNWGFGPDWRCSLPGKGGPICIKHPVKADN
ncbi:MAG: hypothetical protein ABSE69_08450 [Roseiarcus sp.]|jgi:hypothetical protein